VLSDSRGIFICISSVIMLFGYFIVMSISDPKKTKWW
jgi:hypothetical protein